MARPLGTADGRCRPAGRLDGGIDARWACAIPANVTDS